MNTEHSATEVKYRYKYHNLRILEWNKNSKLQKQLSKQLAYVTQSSSAVSFFIAFDILLR